MEILLILFLVGFAICYLIRHPIKTLKFALYTLTFIVLGYIVVITLFFYMLTGANI